MRACVRNYRGKAEAMLGKWLLAAHDLQTGQSIDFDEGTAELQKKIKSHTDSVLRKEAKKRVRFSPVCGSSIVQWVEGLKRCCPEKIRLQIVFLFTHGGDEVETCKTNKILAPFICINARRRTCKSDRAVANGVCTVQKEKRRVIFLQKMFLRFDDGTGLCIECLQKKHILHTGSASAHGCKVAEIRNSDK